MSEMRQRRGDGASTALVEATVSDPPVQAVNGVQYHVKGKWDNIYMSGGVNFPRMELEDIVRMTVMSATTQKMCDVKSMSNATRAIKDKLEVDPYDLSLIKELGLCYFKEFHWDMCSNVMLRGYKRVNEFTDEEDRYEFLMKLCEASYRSLKFKQAHSVLMDIEEPRGGYERKAYLLLACQVHAMSSDASRALSSFSKTIEGEDFDVSIKMWAACALALKKVGILEASKNQMQSKVRGAPNAHLDESRIRTVEFWGSMNIMPEANEEPLMKQILSGKISKGITKVLMMIGAILFLAILYYIEHHNLRKMALKK